MNPKTDQALIQDCLNGHVDAFHTLVRRYEQELYNYLRRMVHDGHVAEDLFQDVFLTAYQNFHKFDLTRPFKPWLYAIATNLARDEYRRRNSKIKFVLDAPTESENTLESTLSTDTPVASELLSNQEEASHIKECLTDLPEMLYTVLIMFHYQEMKYREISEALNIPIGTVKSRLHAAVSALLKAYEKRNPNRQKS